MVHITKNYNEKKSWDSFQDVKEILMTITEFQCMQTYIMSVLTGRLTHSHQLIWAKTMNLVFSSCTQQLSFCTYSLF